MELISKQAREREKHFNTTLLVWLLLLVMQTSGGILLLIAAFQRLKFFRILREEKLQNEFISLHAAAACFR